MVTRLLDAGANPNLKNNDGETALDPIEEDSPLYKSDVWWWLHDAKYN